MTQSTSTGLLDNLRQRRRHPRQRKPGDVPGSLIFEGSQRVEKMTIEAIDYGPQHLTREAVADLSSCSPFSPGFTG
jgi:hypothetical protein